jgi:hypothetical protein
MAIWNAGSWGTWVKLVNYPQGYDANQDVAIPSVWTHVVAVYTQGQYVEYWVNGSLVQSNTIPNDPLYTDPTAPLNSSIGNYDYTPGLNNGFTGAMDDVRIYNRALSANEVKQLHAYESQPGCTPPPSGLVGWWRGDGDANDSVGGHNGTLVNGTGFAPGEVLQAFSFDGVQNCVTNAVPGLTNIQSSFTMEFWVWPTASRASTSEATSGLDGISGQRYAIFPDHGVTGYGGAGVSVGTNGVSVFEHSDVYLPSLLVYDAPIIGWTHIAVVYQSNQPSLYINGLLVRTGLVSTSQPIHPLAWGRLALATAITPGCWMRCPYTTAFCPLLRFRPSTLPAVQASVPRLRRVA